MINQEKRPSLLINSVSNWTALAVTIIVGFFLTPYIISYLGKTGYGIWTLIASIIGYYGILDLGITSAITRYVARYAAQKNYKALTETICTSLAAFCVVGIVIIGVSFAVAGPLSRFFNVSTDYIEKFRQIVWLLGLAAALGFPGNLFGAVVRAHERFVTANSVTIIITIIRAILIVIFLSSGFGLVGIAFSHLITAVIMIVSNYTICKILFSYFRLRLKAVSWSMLRLLLGFGIATTVWSLADIMRFNLDSFVIGKWINLPSVAVYGVAALIIRYFLNFIAQGTSAVLTPRFSSLDGEGEGNHLRQLFMKSVSVASYLSFAIGSLIIIFGKQFITLWVGKDFVGAAPVLWVLAVAYSIALAQTPGVSLVYAKKKHYLFAAVSIIEGIANVILSIYLAPRYGILGVAIGTAVPMLVIKVFVQPIYISRIIGISFIRYWGKLVLPLGLAIGVVVVGQSEPKITFFNNGYISLVLSAVPYILAFVLLYLLVYIITRKRNIQETIR